MHRLLFFLFLALVEGEKYSPDHAEYTKVKPIEMTTAFHLTQNILLFIEILLGALERQNYTYAELSREKDFFSIIIC